jgi:hypothetical protein
MKNVSDKSLGKNKNTFSVELFFFFENRTFYEILLKNIIQPDKAQMIIWRVSVAFCIP